MENRAREVAEWLDYRGLPPTASLKELIEHERENAALAAGFDFVREHRADVRRVKQELDVDAAKSLLGEGLHTGLRKAGTTGASVVTYAAIEMMPAKEWDAVLEFLVRGLNSVGVYLVQYVSDEEKT